MKVTDHKVMTVDLSTNYYSESRRRIKDILELIAFERYCDERDDVACVELIEEDIIKHYEWFEAHMPHLIPYIDCLVVDFLISK